jgi:hypothetical protein
VVNKFKHGQNLNAEKFFSIRKDSSNYHKMSAEWGGFLKQQNQENNLPKKEESV